jgi:CDP-diacylglycerol---glycerol-3-phosphate 3-phosphatidyltransferase
MSILPTEQFFLPALVFAIAGLTDLFDGLLARRYEVVSDFGKLVDPLADKLLVMAALVMLVSIRDDVSGVTWVPPWLVILLLGREIWVTGIRGVAATRGLVISANSSGKIKSILQMVGIFLLLLHEVTFSFLGYIIPFSAPGLLLLFLSVIFSIRGAIEYTVLVINS